jgi:beta-galactosidase
MKALSRLGQRFRSVLAAGSMGAYLLFSDPARSAGTTPENVAVQAQASAFEEYQGMRAGLANDGRDETRWSGIPGHNTGGWFELDWAQPVRVGEVVVFQYDRYVKEMDLQVWNTTNQVWETLQHLGHPDRRMPKVVVCHFPSRLTTRVRLANITNGPSFSEVQVFEQPYAQPSAINLASDADGHFIGMISDPWGSEPLAGVEVGLSGQAKSGAWQAKARTDEHGLFFVPMPLGLSGAVSIKAPATQTGNGSTELQIDAASFQYGLTPANLHRTPPRLDNDWRFAPDPPPDFWKSDFKDQGWSPVSVPAHFEMQGFRSLEGVGGYRKRFRAPRGDGRLKLRFEGVYSGAEVWVNGRRLAYHEGGALPFEVDITDATHAGENLLAMRVTQHTVVSDQLDKMSEYADFPLAGIMRPVYLFRVPPVHIGALALSTTFDAEYRDAKLSARVGVLNESLEPIAQGTLEFQLSDPEGKPVPLVRQPTPVAAGPWERGEALVVLDIARPRHWEAEHPNCYRLEAILKSNGRVLDRVTQRIGFRQTQVSGGQLLINGRPVKIRGTCHHDSHPLLGRAVTGDLERQDLELMKEANLNSLRTSHYPPLPELLDIADELGIYVEDEGSFCWTASVSADDLRVTPRIMQLNAELLARDRNHPSVFMWSVCNESDFGYGFERSHEWMRRADPSRPDGGSYDRGSLELLARHNPISITGIAEVQKVNKPVLWDESWCIFQGIFGDIAEMWLDPGMRDYYAEPLPAIYERMMRAKSIAGTQIWAWSDDIFCVPNRGLEYGRGTTRSHFIENQYRLPGRGLVGDAPWGVVDGWRRKKPEFWITKKLHSPVKLKEGSISLPASGEMIRLAAENQYDFTDLSELRVEWQIGKDRGLARASGPAHQVGQIEVELRQRPVAGQVLELKIHDRPGRVVDAYRFPFGHAHEDPPKLRRPAPAPLRILHENVLAGPGTRVAGNDFDLLFDDASGGLRRGVAFGQALLLEFPQIHLLPAAEPLRSLPGPMTWRLQKFEVQPVGANVRVWLQGAYEHLEGGYELIITSEGALTVQAAFKYSGEKLLVREAGLVLSVPRDCDYLRWQRRAEWSVYPDDHIGRPLGQTRAFSAHPDQLPPTWAWKLDNSPMGCNDFRSTKRHVCWASLAYPEGPGVWLESDGTQHVRAEVQSDRIALHINDWFGGTHSGLWEWTSNYGEGKTIAPGETIKSTVRLRLAQPETRSPKPEGGKNPNTEFRKTISELR